MTDRSIREDAVQNMVSQVAPPTPSGPASSPEVYYADRMETLGVQVGRLRQIDLRCSQGRGLVFLVALVLLMLGVLREHRPLVWLGGLSVVGLVALVFYHDRVQRRLAIARSQRSIHRLQQLRMNRQWSDLPESTCQPVKGIHRLSRNDQDDRSDELASPVSPPTLDAAVANDLDLTGFGSLWQLTNNAYSVFGQRILHDWFLTPASPAEIGRRQASVQRLVSMTDFREQLALHGRMLATYQTDPAAFVSWAEEEGPRFAGRQWLYWTARLLSFFMIATIVASCFRSEWLVGVLAVMTLNLLVNSVWTGAVHDLFNQISAGNYDMFHYTALFEAVDSLPDDTEPLAELKTDMRTGDVSFQTAFSRLQRLVRLSSGRKSRVWVVPWMVMQIFFFWDYHVLHRLEAWQVQFGPSVPRWFRTLGKLEALSSLATLAHDEPDWVFPTVADDQDAIQATSIGHPLLPRTTNVRNDVTVGPTKTFLLVTGSNMSGKSTLLRSIGVNTVLALAGGPVCAANFQTPPVELATSMRITDSLSQGTSFFMAELERLKQIVDRARQMTEADGPYMLFLLDEILLGTNSAERHVAVTRVVGHLLNCRTLGAVSTHDLELATAEGLADACQTVHLRETIESSGTSSGDGDTMTFDYIVRPGVTPTTNALKLLELVGLGPE